MHEIDEKVHWHEPKAGENAGLGKFQRKPMPYDLFMEAEGIPCHRGIGVHRVQDLPLKPWARLGGKGTYIQLWGTEGLWGMYVVEIPGAGALNVEHHLYEKVCLVVEGRGSTEIWLEGQNKKHTFEWQKGSMFAIPLNAYHRFINAATTRTSCSTRRATSTNAFQARMTSSRRRTISSPIRCVDLRCGVPTSYRISSAQNYRSITGVPPVIAVSSH